MKRVDVVIALPQCGKTALIQSLRIPETQIMHDLNTITSDRVIYAGDAYTHKQRLQIIEHFKGYNTIAHVIQPPQYALDWSQVDSNVLESCMYRMQPVTEFEHIKRYHFRSLHEL